MKKFTAGMVKDPERVDQPEGTYRDALNANLYYQKGAVVNEQGTAAITNVGGFVIDEIIGQCALKDGRIVLFFNYTLNQNPTSAISVVDPSAKTNTIIYRNSNLNFKASNTIEATSKIDVNGEILVYFTDNYMQKTVEPFTGIEYISDYNPPRVINITRQEQSSTVTQLYDNADYTVEKLDLFLNSGFIPEFRDIKIEEGGGVVSGTYHLAIAYVDEDLNRTNYLVTSNPVHLVTEHEDAIPTESITGDPQGSQSNKSISWVVDIPVPSNYTHVRPVVIQRFGGGYSQESSEFAYELDIVKIPEVTDSQLFTSLEITYTGLEQVAAASISEVVIDSVRYETAKSFVQLDNRLYISNLRARGDIGYQRFANSIRVSPKVETVQKFDPKRIHRTILNNGYNSYQNGVFTDSTSRYRNIQQNDVGDEYFNSNVRKGYKDVNLSHNYRGYRRSEVYAFYISFVLKDGSETYAYHIPGREAETIKGDTIYENAPLTDITANALDSILGGFDVGEFQDLYPDAHLHEITDTQYMIDQNSTEMSYWENQDERYPTDDEFTVWSVDTGGVPVEISSIKDEKVRHHKMPPNKNLNFSFIDELSNTGDNQVFPNLFGQGEDSNQGAGVVLRESIKILGVEFSNIPIPNFIKDQVQGFKIYYAKRTQQEKTVIGQSTVIPSWYEDVIAVTTGMISAANGPYEDAWFLKGLISPWYSKYPRIKNAPNSPAGDARTEYRAMSVFSFHDFNLLKNKHTLSGASHIDIQKILTMRMWLGGNNKNSQYLKPYILDSTWINATIGNTEWYEWVNNGDGYYDDIAFAGSGGEAIPKGPAKYWTSIWVAQRYDNPGKPLVAGRWNTEEPNASLGYWVNNYQTIFAIAPNSRTYITGSTLLKNTDSSAFNNADYLMHFAGESCAVFGLISGLPVLVEQRNFNPDILVTSSFYAKWWNPTPPSGGPGTWFNPQAFSNLADSNKNLNELNSTISNSEYRSWPTLFLVNLCSYKTNVYKPFDQQKLVWTGYYQPLDDARSAGAKEEDNEYMYNTRTVFGGDTYIGRHSFRTTSQDYGACFFYPHWTNEDGETNSQTGTYFEDGALWNQLNWFPYPWNTSSAHTQQFKYRPIDPYSTAYNFFCESDDLLGFRHQGDNSEGVTVAESIFFDASIGADVVFNGPNNDNTKSENLLYMNNYSAVQDIKVTAPRPKKLFNPTSYPTRTIRSTVDDGSIQDKYRFFLALDYKDIPKNRGEITKVFTLGSILYLHTERSLFVTRGRQQLGLSDNTQAFVGSGDIFEQNPDEMIPTTEGYGGTDCQFASLTTRFGQFFVNRRDRKVYMMSDNISELSSLGMEKWFLDNIPYELESYINLEGLANFDSPTEHFGFHATYDPKYKRIILSKRELVPTAEFLGLIASGVSNIESIKGGISFFSVRANKVVEVLFTDSDYFTADGWTVSYYPEIKVWGSRHSYLPVIFSNNQREYYSIVNGGGGNVWEHSNLNEPGSFYNKVYSFEFEYIDNSQVGQAKIFSAVRYWAEEVASKGAGQNLNIAKVTSPGFTEFYVYNSTQISEQKDIYYLTNARLVNNFWYINEFRDMSKYEFNASTVLANEQLNVQDLFNEGSTTVPPTITMFTEEGVINNNYINANKSWYNQKRFVDHYLGVRLINNNQAGNLVYLYSAGTKFRQSFR
jgi:hypothetical protein